MTELIENKPRRRAMIATLLHFDDPARVVVLPNRDRPSLPAAVSLLAKEGPRHTGLPGRRQSELGRSVELGGSVRRESKDLFWLLHQPPPSGLQHQEPNRNNRRLEAHLNPAKSTRTSLLIATNRGLRFRDVCEFRSYTKQQLVQGIYGQKLCDYGGADGYAAHFGGGGVCG